MTFNLKQCPQFPDGESVTAWIVGYAEGYGGAMPPGATTSLPVQPYSQGFWIGLHDQTTERNKRKSADTVRLVAAIAIIVFQIIAIYLELHSDWHNAFGPVVFAFITLAVSDLIQREIRDQP